MSSPMANETITYKHFTQDELNVAWLNSSLVMSTEERTQKLLLSIASMWNPYEISGETIGEFKMFMLDTFNEHKQYYEEMLTAYEKEFDYKDATKRKVTNKGTDKSVHVELPNKKIDEDDIYAYPNDGDKRTLDSTNEVEDGALFLRAKREYLRQVRNLYNEFAYKFKDCFIHVF